MEGLGSKLAVILHEDAKEGRGLLQQDLLCLLVIGEGGKAAVHRIEGPIILGGGVGIVVAAAFHGEGCFPAAGQRHLGAAAEGHFDVDGDIAYSIPNEFFTLLSVSVS